MATKTTQQILVEMVERLDVQNAALMKRISSLEQFILRDNVNWSEDDDGLTAMLAAGSMTEFVVDTVKSKLYVTTGTVEWGDN